MPTNYIPTGIHGPNGNEFYYVAYPQSDDTPARCGRCFRGDITADRTRCGVCGSINVLDCYMAMSEDLENERHRLTSVLAECSDG